MDDGTYYYEVKYNEVDSDTFRNFGTMIIAMMLTHCNYGEAGKISFYDWIWTHEYKVDWEIPNLIERYIYVAENETQEVGISSGSYYVSIDHMNTVMKNTLGWCPEEPQTSARLTNDGVNYYVPIADGEGVFYEPLFSYSESDGFGGYNVRFVLNRYFEFTEESDAPGIADAFFSKDSKSDFGWIITGIAIR